MYRKKRIGQVKVQYFHHYWSLEKTLRPWWKVTRWGILLDWCYPYMDYEHRLVKIARYTSVVFVSLLLFTMTIFQVFRLGVGIMTMTTVHSVIPYFVWLASLPITLVTQLRYVFCGKEYLTFFEDWGKFENQPALSDRPSCVISMVKKTRILTVAWSVVMKIGMLSALGYTVLFHSHAPYFLSYYQTLRNIFTLPFLIIIHLVCISMIVVLNNMSGTVPSLIFYHAGLEIRILQEEIQHLFLTFDPSANCLQHFNQSSSNFSVLLPVKVREITKSYENLSMLVARANSLFGPQMFLSYGMGFVVICTMLYSKLYEFRGDQIDAIAVYSTILIITSFDLITCNLLTSNIFHASEKLRIVLASLLNRHWNRIAKNERDILLAFLGCLRSDPLAACPLGLFRVTPSILLNMTSLIMSYVIIMLQSK